MVFCLTAGVVSAQTEKGKKATTNNRLPKPDEKAAEAKRKAQKDADFANRQKGTATQEKFPAALVDPRAN